MVSYTMPVLSKPAVALVLGVLATGLHPAPTIANDAESAKLITEDAFPVDPGSTELEFGYHYATADTLFNNDGQVFARGDLSGQIILAKATRGIKSGLDASIEFGWRDLIEDEDGELGDGIGNVTVSAKWLFSHHDQKGLALAWLPGFTAPFAGDAVNERIAPGQNYWSMNNCWF